MTPSCHQIVDGFNDPIQGLWHCSFSSQKAKKDASLLTKLEIKDARTNFTGELRKLDSQHRHWIISLMI